MTITENGEAPSYISITSSDDSNPTDDEFNIHTTDVNDVGTHTVQMTWTLDDYPSAIAYTQTI